MLVTLNSEFITGLKLEFVDNDFMIDYLYLDEQDTIKLFDALKAGRFKAIRTVQSLSKNRQNLTADQAEDCLARTFGEGLFSRKR